MAHQGKGLKVYINPGLNTGKVKVGRAIRTLNRKLGGPALQVTTNKAEANVIVRGTPRKVLQRNAKALKSGKEGYATSYVESPQRGPGKGIPKGYGAARTGQTIVTIDPTLQKKSRVAGKKAGLKNSAQYGRTSSAEVAAHELQHSLGVTHAQMGMKGGVVKSGLKITPQAKAKAQKVSGLKPHQGEQAQSSLSRSVRSAYGLDPPKPNRGSFKRR